MYVYLSERSSASLFTTKEQCSLSVFRRIDLQLLPQCLCFPQHSVSLRNCGDRMLFETSFFCSDSVSPCAPIEETSLKPMKYKAETDLPPCHDYKCHTRETERWTLYSSQISLITLNSLCRDCRQVVTCTWNENTSLCGPGSDVSSSNISEYPLLWFFICIISGNGAIVFK
jgi:hypothetical protein